MNVEAARQPNSISKGQTVDPITGTAKPGKDADVFMSPSNFLNGKSPRMSNFLANHDDESV